MKHLYTRFLLLTALFPILAVSKLGLNTSHFVTNESTKFEYAKAVNTLEDEPKPSIRKPLPVRKKALDFRTPSVVLPSPSHLQPLPYKPFIASKPLPTIKGMLGKNEDAFFKYDSASKSFQPYTTTINDEQNSSKNATLGFDPVRFTLTTNKDSVAIGEEFEITITAYYTEINPMEMFQFEGSNEFTLKMVFPEGFIQTGDTYYDYIQGKVTKEQRTQAFTIKGYFENETDNNSFTLLRSRKDAGINDVWERKVDLKINYIYRDILTPENKTTIKDDTSHFLLSSISENVLLNSQENPSNNTMFVANNKNLCGITSAGIQAINPFNTCSEPRTYIVTLSLWTTDKFAIIPSNRWLGVQSVEVNSLKVLLNGIETQINHVPGNSYCTFIIPDGFNNGQTVRVSVVINSVTVKYTYLLFGTLATAICNMSNLEYTRDLTKVITLSLINPPSPPLITTSHTTIESGSSVTLTAKNCPSNKFRWDNGATTSVRVDLPETNTTMVKYYSAVCIDYNGCESTQSLISITVNPKQCLDATIVATTTPAVIGDNLTVAGCNTATSITWKKDNVIISAPPTNISSGTYSVTCEKTGCPTSSATLNINCTSPIPVIVANPSPAQVGGNLNATGCEGGVLRWKKDNQNIIGNPTNISVGIYSVTCDKGGCSTSSPASVSVSGTSCTTQTPIISSTIGVTRGTNQDEVVIPYNSATNKVELTADASCSSALSGSTSSIVWFNLSADLAVSIGSGSSIQAGEGKYVAQCIVRRESGEIICQSTISHPILVKPSGSCAAPTPVIAGISTIVLPNTASTTTLTTSTNCSYEGVRGQLDWFKNGVYQPSLYGNSVNVGIGTYYVNCKISEECQSTSNTIVVRAEGCSSYELIAWSNATANICGASVGSSLNFTGGLAGATDYTSNWSFNGTIISNSDYFIKTQTATKADEGTYTFTVNKGGETCAANIYVRICECDFKAYANFKINPDGKPYIWASTYLNGSPYECSECTFTWTLNNNFITHDRDFTVNANPENRGLYRLDVKKADGCQDYPTVDVTYPATPSYQGYIENAFCDEIKGWIKDVNNPGILIGSLEHKTDGSVPEGAVRIVFYNQSGSIIATKIAEVNPSNGYYSLSWPSEYKDGNTYQVKVKFPDGNFSVPFATTPQTLACCNLALSNKSIVCNSVSAKATYTIYFTGHNSTKALKYQLYKKNINSLGVNVFVPVYTSWQQIPPSSLGFLTFSNLERGYYQIEVIEGTSETQLGCKIFDEFLINCEPVIDGCDIPPLITAVPEGNIMQGSNITPILYAESISSGTGASTGLNHVKLLDGNSGMILSGQTGSYSNGWDAWIRPEPNETITVGYIGTGEKHRYLLEYWGTDHPYNGILSVGSNGITYIESIPGLQNSRRVSVSIEKPIRGWNHVSLIMRNHKAEIYLNGALIGSSSQSIYAIHSLPPSDTYSTKVGYDKNKGFVGLIDEIKIWGNALGSNVSETEQNLKVLALSRDDKTLNNDKYWSFENAISNTNVINNGGNNLLYEGNTQVPNILGSSIDSAPQNQDYKWLYKGTVVGTGTKYSTTISQLIPNAQTYVLKYTGNNGKSCETQKTIYVTPCLSINPATDQIICESTPLEITAIGSLTGVLWYKVGSNLPITVDASTPEKIQIPKSVEGDGTYYAKNANGCESSKIKITHEPTSKVIASIFPNPAVSGSTVQFKGTYTNPKSPSSALGYLWEGPNGYISETQNPILENVSKPTHEGEYKFSIAEKLGNLTCISSATTKLLVSSSDCIFTVDPKVECIGGLGKITVSVLGNPSGRILQYSLDGTNWINTNVFQNLFNGQYKLYVRSYVGTTAIPPDQLIDPQFCYSTSVNVNVSCSMPVSCGANKKLNYDRWDEIPGTEINELSSTINSIFTTRGKSVSTYSPDFSSPTQSFLIRNTTTQNFIARIYGKICIPITGNYKFYLSADNSAKLFLNAKDGQGLKQVIWTPDNPNNHDAEIESASIILEGGQMYDIEVHHKQGVSASFVILQWQIENNPKQVISAEYLHSDVVPSIICPSFEIVTTPNIIPETVVEGSEVKAIAIAPTGSISNSFVWTATGNYLYDTPKVSSGTTTKSVPSNTPVYLLPIIESSETSPQEKVFRVAMEGAPIGCFKNIKLNITSQKCDCPTGGCSNVEILNPILVSSFDITKNFVVETTYLDEFSSTGSQAITYFDGLGRPNQKINIRSGPEQQDLVQPIIYDAFGRQEQNYLSYPVAGNNGLFVNNANIVANSWYSDNKSSTQPYTLAAFEASPLNRLTSRTSVGNDVLSNVESFEYSTNSTNEVRMFTVNGSNISIGYYVPNTLFKTVTKETAQSVEGQLITVEYKDLNGQLVCKDVGGLKTYYVYNDLSQLVCIVPPEAVEKLSTTASIHLFGSDPINKYLFEYAFNNKGLMSWKKVPGGTKIELSYNDRNLLSETTDSRNDNSLKTYFEYDPLNRLTKTYIKNTATDKKLISETFYDTYSVIPSEKRLEINASAVPEGFSYNWDMENMKGLVVGSWSANYGADGNPTEGGSPSTLYYDSRHRLVQVVSKNHTGGGNDYQTTSLDFAGRTKATYSKTTHWGGGGELITQTKNGIDYGGRFTATCQRIEHNGYLQNWESIGSYTYNALGEMTQKILGCRTQVVDYAYNIKGWLTGMNNPSQLINTTTKEYDFFAMKLNYAGDGNIIGQAYTNGMRKYTSAVENYNDPYDIDPKKYNYSYQYDPTKRLKYANLDALTPRGTEATNFRLDYVTYDNNGNIKTLKRSLNNGSTTLDNLTYAYDGNRLTNLTEEGDGTKFANGGSYAYFSDGSISQDNTKGVNFTYTPNNLPSKITGGAGNYAYLYTANGAKLQTKIGTTKTYDYIGNAVFLNNTLEFASTAEGRWLPKEQLKAYNPDMSVSNTANYGRYEYILKDHLGNSRVACRCVEKPNATTPDQAYLPIETQTNHYDPWGADLSQELLPPATTGVSYYDPKNRFTYNGKETQGTLSLLDYGARMYDPNIGRWGVIDPLAEKTFHISSYAYANNNPVNMIDPNGQYAVSVHYQLTYDALRARGYSHNRADLIAHYSSTYADHPSEGVRALDHFGHNLGARGHLAYRNGSGINYNLTAASQDESNSVWHSMMSNAEAEGGMTEEQATNRGLKFGWDNIFAQKDGENLGKLGQGIHALQDAIAHQGVKTDDHLGRNMSSVKMLANDMYGSTKEAALLTKSALVVYDLLQGKKVGLKDGDVLNFKGMSADQFKQVTQMLINQGFQGTIKTQ